jgi:hypothetical protein
MNIPDISSYKGMEMPFRLKEFSVNWVIIMGVFMSGFILCVLLILLGLYYIFKTSNTTISRQQPKIPVSDCIPQLTLSGWLKISTELLASNPEKSQVIESEDNQWFPNVMSLYKSSKSYSTYIISRFMGDKKAQLNTIEEKEQTENPYQEVYAILLQKQLNLYSDEHQTILLQTLTIPQYNVTLTPDTISDHEYFLVHNPICLKSTQNVLDRTVYLYLSSPSEKENWFILLSRASKLQIFADNQAAAAFYEDKEEVKQYGEAMQKLILATETKDGEEQSATAWLNALVGRMYY